MVVVMVMVMVVVMVRNKTGWCRSQISASAPAYPGASAIIETSRLLADSSSCTLSCTLVPFLCLLFYTLVSWGPGTIIEVLCTFFYFQVLFLPCPLFCTLASWGRETIIEISHEFPRLPGLPVLLICPRYRRSLWCFIFLFIGLVHYCLINCLLCAPWFNSS